MRRLGSIHHRLVTLLVTLALAVGLGAAVSPPAQAAPRRDDGQTEPVWFIHGFSTDGSHDCGRYWGEAINAFYRLGWAAGKLETIAFYTGDTSCTIRINNGNRDLSIMELGRQLAWNVYDRESKNGRSIDIVAHSMGGLIARAAIYGMWAYPKGVPKSQGGWPPYIYIEDVITIGTPHDGAWTAVLCGGFYKQCEQMEPGSDFLDALDTRPNVQASAGTDWTLIGTADDEAVGESSATSRSFLPGHRVNFKINQGLYHYPEEVRNTTGGWRKEYWNYYDGVWRDEERGASIIVTARNAAYFWSRW